MDISNDSLVCLSSESCPDNDDNVEDMQIKDFWETIQEEIDSQEALSPMQEIALLFVSYLNSLPTFNREMVFTVVNQIQDELLTPVAHTIFEKIKAYIPQESKKLVLNSILETTMIFDPVSTEYKFLQILKQRECFKDPSNNIYEMELEPQPSEYDDEVLLKEIKRGGAYVGLSNLFKKIFSNESNLKAMLNHIETIKNSPPDINDSFLKGLFWQKKIAQHLEHICIPYMLYSDGFEINNPLGSKANKQSLNGYYLSFPALPRHLSGLIENTFLVMLGYCAVEKTLTNEEILTRLIDEIIELEQNGIDLELDGKTQKIHFLFGGLRGDNLGLNKILDYSSSFVANYPCRTCLMHLDEIRVSVNDDPTLYRNEDNYNKCLKRDFSSTGVHCDSIFNSIPNFHITELKHVDAMHDFYEGYAHDAITACFSRFIEQGHLTIDQLNNRIKCYDYEYNDRRNKPEPIAMDHIRSRKLKTSAGQMKSLIENVLLMIGDLIPDTREWIFLTSLVKLGDLIMSPFFTAETLRNLRTEIANNLTEYLAIFDERLKPKCHFLTHYLVSIENFGPAKYTACFIPEARHKIYKRIAKETDNRKNIALTITVKDQLILAYKIITKQKLFELDVIKPGKAVICSVSVILPLLLLVFRAQKIVNLVVRMCTDSLI